jgi:small-conductance mechanosensitive channel
MRRLALPVALTTLTLFILLAVSPVRASQDEGEAEAAAPQGYPVIVDGYELFRIRQNLGAISAEERAQRISAGLEDLARTQDFDPGKITATEEGGVATVRYGEQLLVTINDAEARPTGLPRLALAGQYGRLLQEKLPEIHVQHTPRYLWRAATYAAITFLVYLAICWIIILLTRWLLRRLGTTAGDQIKGIKIQQSEILAGARLASLLAWVVKFVRIVLLAVLTFAMLAKAFSFFPWTREHSERLLGYVLSPLVVVAMAIVNYLPKAFYIFVIVAVLYFVLRFIHIIAIEVERGRIRFSGFYPEWVQPTYKIVRVLIYAFGAVMIYPYLPGESSPAFKGVSVFIGLLLSLGSTSAVANFVAGIILIYTRGFRVGDWVTIGDNTGEVVQMSMLATHVRTIRNEEVTIPNSVVLGSFVTNFSLLASEKGVVLHTSVTIGYDNPWRTIHQLLIDAALKTKYILHDPQPFVLQSNLQDSYVQYEINAYTDHPLQMPFIYSDLHANIQDSFYEAGVEIMSPIFHALRDGNRTAIPKTYLPKNYQPHSFRVQSTDPKPDDGSPHS